MKSKRIHEVWDAVHDLEQQVEDFQAELRRERDALADTIALAQPIVDSVPAIARAVAQVTRITEELEQRLSQLATSQDGWASATASQFKVLRDDVAEVHRLSDATKQILDDLSVSQLNLERRIGNTETLQQDIHVLRDQGEYTRRVTDELIARQDKLDQQMATLIGWVEERGSWVRAIAGLGRNDSLRQRVNTIEVRPGRRFEIVVGEEASDGLSEHYASDGTFLYPALIDMIEHAIGTQGRILDVGAHIGGVTLAVAALGYEVVAVEASARNVELLQASVARNRFTHVQVVHAAASDKPGMVRFLPNGPHGRILGETSEGVDVQAVRLDDLLDEIGWERPDFIKLDVEGSELAAIRGMRRRLALPDAPPLFFEANGQALWEFGLEPAELLDEVRSLDYQLFEVRGQLAVPLASDHFQIMASVDYLALKVTPASLEPLIARKPLTHEEIVADILATAQTPPPWSAYNRVHLARVLVRAPHDVRGDPDVRRILSELQQDSVVQAAIARS